MDAGENNPDAWDAALACANYKSFLNGYLVVSITTMKGEEPVTTHYHFKSSSQFGSPQQTVAGRVPPTQAAKFLIMGEADSNASLAAGPDWIIFDGGGISLDNMEAKRVIFRNVYIFYTGAPLKMQDVYFIGCTFVIERQDNAPNLVFTLLEPPAKVTFAAS